MPWKDAAIHNFGSYCSLIISLHFSNWEFIQSSCSSILHVGASPSWKLRVVSSRWPLKLAVTWQARANRRNIWRQSVKSLSSASSPPKFSSVRLRHDSDGCEEVQVLELHVSHANLEACASRSPLHQRNRNTFGEVWRSLVHNVVCICMYLL